MGSGTVLQRGLGRTPSGVWDRAPTGFGAEPQRGLGRRPNSLRTWFNQATGLVSPLRRQICLNPVWLGGLRSSGSLR